MATLAEKKKGGVAPVSNTKKVETKKKVDKLLDGLPVFKTNKSNVVEKKPQPKDNEGEWVLQQLDVANEKILELEEKLIQSKSSYEKLLSQVKGGNVEKSTGNPNLQQEVQHFFNDLVKRDQSRAKFGGAVVKLNYTGQGSKGLLQEFLARFPFLKP